MTTLLTMKTKPVQPHKAHILIVEDDKGKREIILRKSVYTIGRSGDCDIKINSAFVSRHHATMLRKFDEEGYVYYEISDGDGQGNYSANGILINARKITNQKLKHGDKIVFGPQIVLIYQYCQRDIFPSLPSEDPFDITLIDPAMMISELED